MVNYVLKNLPVNAMLTLHYCQHRDSQSQVKFSGPSDGI